jgi:hypothetical protein
VQARAVWAVELRPSSLIRSADEKLSSHLSLPIARTLVVSFARARLNFSIQVGQVKILDIGHHVKVRAHRSALKIDQLRNQKYRCGYVS